ncbi:MAG TPA: Imm8 family immunity protein [Verrucomicrobiae bacterium]|nr:Imm8 family immunity protein [Verrucomicrobiae bacterium]
MKPLLKGQDCTDHDPIEKWSPKDAAEVNYWLCLHIGPDRGKGADLFYVNVLSWVAANELSKEELSCRKSIIVDEYSWPAVEAAVRGILESSVGENWTEITDKLRVRFDWEFEGYRPYQRG